MLVNGSPHSFFTSSCGIRLGDPLSSAFFTFLADLFFRILARAEQEGRINGVKVSRIAPRVSHLMYTDDLVIYCKADVLEAEEVKKYLNLYCLWSG